MNEKIRKQTEFEKERQLVLDRFYLSKGWTPDRSGACKAFDLVLAFESKGITSTVEEKIRAVEYPDFGIEIIQDVFSKNDGWFYTSSADLIFQCHYGKIYSVKWSAFKSWFRENYKDINRKKSKNKFSTYVSVCGFGLTINIGVPWEVIPNNLYKKIEFNESDFKYDIENKITDISPLTSEASSTLYVGKMPPVFYSSSSTQFVQLSLF